MNRPHPPRRLLFGCLLLAALSQAAAAQAPPAQVADVDKELSRPELEMIYRRELEGFYPPATFEQVYAAHKLLEDYFASGSAAGRAKAVKGLKATALSPVLLGRLTRLRLHWPRLEGGAIYYVNERVGPHTVRYFLGTPKQYDRTKAWPLVIKLPGAEAFTTNPPPDGDQAAAIYRGWMQEELAKHGEALVLMPLLNLDELWGPNYEGMNHVIQPMLHAAERADVDVARVYLIGHSMSGHAAWNLALHYPTYFAAFNPLAGSATGDWQRLRLINLRNVLPVVWHDANDDALPVERTRAIVKALRGLNLDVDYNETKSVGHTPTDEIAEAEYVKLVARTRALYPKQVWLQSNRPDSQFNRADWVQVYQELRPGKEQRLRFRHGRGDMRVFENAYRVDAAVVKPNQIEVKADNVAIMRLYLNDRLVDLSKPVTVTVNKKGRFEGMAEPDPEEMLKDQLFLGRGWRYFTTVIDLDLVETRPATKPAAAPAKAPAARPPVSR